MVLMGDVTEQDLYEAFREQAIALEAGGAHACCVETMSAADEAIQAVRAVKENTALEVICTFTFEREVDGAYYTMMGVTPSQAATAAIEAGADIIGTNCSQGPGPMVSIVGEMRAAAPTVPIIVHPNAGRPMHTEQGDIYPETPESMSARVHELVAAGATIVGGCCGTTPAHIRSIAMAIDIERMRLA
jgi:5-methyltetrahydrofolate--homocysteine methyltransferase